jgi:quinoprotein glucose dehydrogenase
MYQRPITLMARRFGGAMAAAVLLAGCSPSGTASLAPLEKYTKWTSFEGAPDASHFSALDQVNKSNVRQLQVAWSYPIGDASAYGFNPIVIDTMLYALGRNSSVVAVNAATGRELWLNPLADATGTITNRGIMYWESPDRSDRRILTSKGNFLYALNALTGQPVQGFGTNGRIDLRTTLGRDARLISRAQSPTPGRVFENLVILGTATGEEWTAAPGHIRAFDVRTGNLVWIFHTIPQPGEFGYDTWPAESWKTVGGANAWGGLSVDEKRGIVYVPLGSATYDFYGADRPGANLFSNSLVALDARTGKRIWHYQTVHHDLWDYDLVSTPTLLTVKHDGKMVDAVAQAGKTGFLFVFDRVTGQPLWPIEERAVPKSDMPGEVTSPTQPYPTWPKPFAVQSFTEADVNPYIENKAELDSIRLAVRNSANQGLFTPPSTRPTMQMPGNAGGANWGSGGADPRNGTYYVLSKNEPTMLQMERIVPGVFGTGTSQIDRGHFTYQQNCQACHGPNRTGTPPQIPSLVGVTDRLTPDQIRTTVHEGRGNMPAFRDLSDAEVAQVTAYLQAPELASGLSARPISQEGADQGPMRFQTGYGYMRASGGMWAIKPPYETLTAYDLNTGNIKWQTQVGDVASLKARGITGQGAASLRGGPAITAGGLIFVMAGDELLAFDKDNGKQLWSGKLPTAAEGIPTVYEVGGRQYIVATAAAQGGGPGAGGGARSYVAFALPRR